MAVRPQNSDSPEDSLIIQEFIDRIHFEKFNLKTYKKGISCFVEGVDAFNSRSTTKIEIEKTDSKTKVFHYVNGIMQNDFHPPKKTSKTTFAEPQPKSDRELIEDFFFRATSITVSPQEPNEVNHER